METTCRINLILCARLMSACGLNTRLQVTAAGVVCAKLRHESVSPQAAKKQFCSQGSYVSKVPFFATAVVLLAFLKKSKHAQEGVTEDCAALALSVC